MISFLLVVKIACTSKPLNGHERFCSFYIYVKYAWKPQSELEINKITTLHKVFFCTAHCLCYNCSSNVIMIMITVVTEAECVMR